MDSARDDKEPATCSGYYSTGMRFHRDSRPSCAGQLVALMIMLRHTLGNDSMVPSSRPFAM